MAKSIYKYREFNQSSIELLVNRELWFAKPDSFNDPFECQLADSDINDILESKYDLTENEKNPSVK